MTDPTRFFRPGSMKCHGCGAYVCWVRFDGKQIAVDLKRVRLACVHQDSLDAVWLGSGFTLHEDTCPRIDAIRKAKAKTLENS